MFCFILFFSLSALTISSFNLFHLFKTNGIKSRLVHWRFFQSRIRSNFEGSSHSISPFSQHLKGKELAKTSTLYFPGSSQALHPQKKTHIPTGLGRLSTALSKDNLKRVQFEERGIE